MRSITGAPDEAYWRIARSATLLVKGIMLSIVRFFQPKEPSLETNATKHAVFVIAFDLNDESIAHFYLPTRKINKASANRRYVLCYNERTLFWIRSSKEDLRQ
jgi:hypothetical protein